MPLNGEAVLVAGKRPPHHSSALNFRAQHFSTYLELVVLVETNWSTVRC